jgi:S-adenosylmethionine decarboxylase
MSTGSRGSHSTGSQPDDYSYMAVWGSVSRGKADEVQQGFEGPEKRLEMMVKGGSSDEKRRGLREVAVSEWEDVIAILNAKIVSCIQNDDVDSYVLTESSLFVASNRVVLITCGTTTLLNAMPLILDLISRHDMAAHFCSFMRKDFSYPWKQVGPHANMEAEYDLLKQYLPLGKPYIFGPVDGDHYFCYIYDDIEVSTADMHLSLVMYEMAEDVASRFFSDEFYPTGPETALTRRQSGVDTLVEGWLVQDLQFAPCGYSINAISGPHYQTMHITPESHCSFASFETNLPLGAVQDDAERVIERVVGVFRPLKFSAIAVCDPESGITGRIENSYEALGDIPGYTCVNSFVAEFAPRHFVVGSQYERIGAVGASGAAGAAPGGGAAAPAVGSAFEALTKSASGVAIDHDDADSDHDAAYGVAPGAALPAATLAAPAHVAARTAAPDNAQATK